MNKQETFLHRDCTNSYLGFWRSGEKTLIVAIDDGGYTGVHLSKDEWPKVRAKLDELFFSSCEKNPADAQPETGVAEPGKKE